MKHLHAASGLYFECGELMEFPANGIRKTYDMTVITLWGDPEDDPEAPTIVGYYFGDYDEKTTDYYIDQWLQQQAMHDAWLKLVGDCLGIANAYDLTNKGHLDDTQQEKVTKTIGALNELLEAITYT